MLKSRLGLGFVEKDHVRSHPRLLEDFEIGDKVVLIHHDDFVEFFDEISKKISERVELLDKCINSELSEEDLERSKEIIEFQKEIDKDLN